MSTTDLGSMMGPFVSKRARRRFLITAHNIPFSLCTAWSTHFLSTKWDGFNKASDLGQPRSRDWQERILPVFYEGITWTPPLWLCDSRITPLFSLPCFNKWVAHCWPAMFCSCLSGWLSHHIFLLVHDPGSVPDSLCAAAARFPPNMCLKASVMLITRPFCWIWTHRLWFDYCPRGWSWLIAAAAERHVKTHQYKCHCDVVLQQRVQTEDNPVQTDMW